MRRDGARQSAPPERSVDRVGNEFGRSDHGACAVSYTHLRAHETVLDLVCRLLLEKKKNKRGGTKNHERIEEHAKSKHVGKAKSSSGSCE